MSSHRQGKGRYGQPRRGQSASAETDVASDRRNRLIDAMVELAGERGYANASVTALSARAGVSRKVFYECFPARRDLLLDAFDAVVPSAFERVRESAERPPARMQPIDGLTGELCRLAERSRGTLALATIEIAAANPSGLHRRYDLMSDYGRIVEQCLNHNGSRMPLMPGLCQALAGSAHRTVLTHARNGRSDLPGLARQLARWMHSYRPLPVTLARMTRTHGPAPDRLVGGRAPGTLTMFPDGSPPGALAERTLSLAVHSDLERILDAVAQLNSRVGYVSLTAEALAAQAGLSERVFRSYFRSKNEAFAAALEIGHMKGLAVVQRAKARAPDWAAGACTAIQALLVFLASEPFFTRMAFVDAPLAGAKTSRRAHEHVQAYTRLLFDGAPRRRRPVAIAAEAAVYSVFELAFHYAVQNRTSELVALVPEAAYLTLAPFLGPEQATSAALS